MVSPNNRFLIDAAFIVERTHKMFFGTQLITAAGRDHTFTFGFVRDFLRLRRNLGIREGVIIFGRETYSVASRDRILDLIVVLNELRIPHVHDPLNLGLHVIGLMRTGFTHIVTANRRFLQFCTDALLVVLPREDNQIEWDWMSSDDVKTMMGIVPKDIPTYLALTDPSSSAAVTTKQAIRLVELYESVDSIYRNLAQVVSAPIRRKLAECETSICQRYAENRCDPGGYPMNAPVHVGSLNELDTANNRHLLTRYGFHSLLTLLATSHDVRRSSHGRQLHSESYHAVVDREHLQELESVVRASKLCSIDTESDDKDPRAALEHLAIVEPIARRIVEVRRLRSQIVRLESISAASHEGKLYLLFSQIKSRTGLVASVAPSMFDIEGISELKSCFDRRVRDLFVDAKTSLRLLAEVTKDPVLISVTASKSNVDPVVAKHPLMQELDSDEFLLRLAVGQSDTALSKKFLVDRFKIATMRHDLEKRYQTMFRWLNNFRRWARTKGYATDGDLRKYIDGLKSADVARRGQSVEHAVRWLIRY